MKHTKHLNKVVYLLSQTSTRVKRDSV